MITGPYFSRIRLVYARSATTEPHCPAGLGEPRRKLRVFLPVTFLSVNRRKQHHPVSDLHHHVNPGGSINPAIIRPHYSNNMPGSFPVQPWLCPCMAGDLIIGLNGSYFRWITIITNFPPYIKISPITPLFLINGVWNGP